MPTTKRTTPDNESTLQRPDEVTIQTATETLPVAEEKDVEKRKLEAPVMAALFGNRAQVLLQLREFVAAVDDCRKCLKEDPENLKAFYRAAKGSLHSGLYKQSVEFCERGLQVGGRGKYEGEDEFILRENFNRQDQR